MLISHMHGRPPRFPSFPTRRSSDLSTILYCDPNRSWFSLLLPPILSSPSLLPQHQIHHPAAADMRPRPAAMAQDVLVAATSLRNTSRQLDTNVSRKRSFSKASISVK